MNHQSPPDKPTRCSLCSDQAVAIYYLPQGCAAHPDLTVLPQVAAYLAVGGAMFTALLLQAFGSRLVPLACCAVALAAEAACRGAGVAAQLVACTQLLIGLAGYAALVLGSATRHAC